MTYLLKITKNKLSLSLTSENKELIAQEFGKFAAAFANIDYELIAPVKETVAIPQQEENSFVETTIEEASEQITKEVFDEQVVEPETSPVKSKLPANFAKVLAAKTQEPTTNVIEKKVSELKNIYLQMQNIIREKNLKNEVDYIVAASYCLSHYEGRMSFTEEDIKSKIVPFYDEELDHNYVLDAVDKNFIKVLPDFTGFSDTIEFELTQYGEEYFLNEL